MKQKWIAILLTLCMLVGILPTGVFAADSTVTEQGLTFDVYSDHAVVTGVTEDVASDLTIPDMVESVPVTEIQSMAFFWTDGLESVTIPDRVTKIGQRCFAECYTLREVRLPENLKELPEGMFLNCWELAEVDLPEGMTTIGWDAFEGCRALTEVLLPETVTTVGNYAFTDCTSLEFVYLPEGLTAIGAQAFAGCDALKQLFVPATVKSIEEKAFGFDCWLEPYGDCRIYVYAGSDAVRYAREYEIDMVLMAFDDDNEAGDWIWASDSIYNCVAAGLINGYPGNLFQPGKNLRRIELVTIMYRLYQELGGEFDIEWPEHPFTDAKGEWYREALTWAYNEDIVKGKTTTAFAPDDPVKREEMAAILYRFLTTYFEMDPVKSNNLAQFRDAAQVDDYARTAMEFCISEGIISGVGDGMLAPRATATRAQISCVMDRAFIQ